MTLDNRVVLDSGINQNTTLLFADGGLGVDNTHYITLTANISDTTQIFSLDRALVESTLNNGCVYYPVSILGRTVLITLMQRRIPYINGLRQSKYHFLSLFFRVADHEHLQYPIGRYSSTVRVDSQPQFYLLFLHLERNVGGSQC